MSKKTFIARASFWQECQKKGIFGDEYQPSKAYKKIKEAIENGQVEKLIQEYSFYGISKPEDAVSLCRIWLKYSTTTVNIIAIEYPDGYSLQDAFKGNS